MQISRAGAVFAFIFAASAGAQTRVVTVPSKLLGEDRIVHVSLPPNYGVAKQRYHVTYLLDGHVPQFFDLTVAAAAYDLPGAAHEYTAPPQIIIGVDQRDRGADLGRNQEVFTRFLAEELVPFIDREYRTTAYRTLIGHSLGGRFALMSFCRVPGVFPAVIAISPGGGDSTSADAMMKCLTTAFASGTSLRQLVVSSGEREARIHAGVLRLRDFLQANAPKHWRWIAIDGPGLSHTETPLATIPPGIRFVHHTSVWEIDATLADSIMRGSVDPEATINRFYRDLSTRLGVRIEPSLKWRVNAARLRVRLPDAKEAEYAIRQLISAYPEDLEGYGHLSELAVRRGDNGAARRALEDARRMLGRLIIHDAYDRARKAKVIDDALAAIR